MTTQVSRHLAARRRRVYKALLDLADVARWRFPSRMACEVHEFEPYEGGRVRISFTYEFDGRAGKTAGRTDTYRGRFVKLVPHELVVEVDEFETSDVDLAGEMTMTFRLEDAQDGGTMLFGTHEGLPEGLSRADSEASTSDGLGGT